MDNSPDAPRVMPLHLLEEITNGFSTNRRFGGGAYGDVYLGVHTDGQKIAVKVLRDNLYISNENFDHEYQNLARLHHKNIVRLVGYCNEIKREYVQHDGSRVLAERTKRVLCFEYMHNGSLDNFISDESNVHNWRTRYAIIKGICEGLEYLHEKLERPMNHLDLKPANVLLEENMTPKIADFGLSRLYGGETQMTRSAIGTRGFIPPEYIDAGLISKKFDIFSLGVVIIKIMTGRDGYFRSAEMSTEQFVESVHIDWMNRLQVPSVNACSVQVRRCIEIALSCVEFDRHKRPSIGVIVNNLNKTESMVPEALIFYTESSVGQLCNCTSSETEMLRCAQGNLSYYPLCVTDNRGRIHESTITNFGDWVGGTSTSKIIDCTEGLSKVNMIDVHSTEPWILAAGHFNGQVSIWNHETQRIVKAFHNIGEEEVEFRIQAAKFIDSVQCFVVGDNRGYIHVYSCENFEKLQKFRAHARPLNSLAVHPSEPFVLSTSSDALIKLWNYVNGWQCIQTFEGHSRSVLNATFDPRTARNTFASLGINDGQKIWNIHSPTPIDEWGHGDITRYVDYYIPSGDMAYLITYCLRYARLYDARTKREIRTVQGLQMFGCGITVVERLLGHPILVTVSRDQTVSFCDLTTHRFENRVKFDLGAVMSCAYINMTKSLAIGCQDGIAIMKID